MSQATPGESATKPPPRPRRPWVTALLLLVIFISGGVVGAGLAVLVKPEPPSRGRPKTAAQIHDRFMERISEKVDLSEDDRQRVSKVVAGFAEDMMALTRSIGPRMLESCERFDKQMRANLNDAQCRQWDAYYRKLSSGWSRKAPATAPATRSSTQSERP